MQIKVTMTSKFYLSDSQKLQCLMRPLITNMGTP